jgi:hypothetical protein
VIVEVPEGVTMGGGVVVIAALPPPQPARVNVRQKIAAERTPQRVSRFRSSPEGKSKSGMIESQS